MLNTDKFREKLIKVIEKITKTDFDYVIKAGEQPDMKMVKRMDEIINEMLKNPIELQREELMGVKVVEFEDYCQQLWSKIPHFVPCSFMDAY